MTRQEAIILFDKMHPDFFQLNEIRNMDADEIMEEQILHLNDFDQTALEIPVPENVTFGWYEGDTELLMKAVSIVEESWTQFNVFKTGERIYCAMVDGKIASFCIAEDMGTYELNGKQIKIAGPGCVGTVPEFRRKGIGLKMVQKVTQILKEEGYDISWIHWTGVGHWYARLGYERMFQWNNKGII